MLLQLLEDLHIPGPHLLVSSFAHAAKCFPSLLMRIIITLYPAIKDLRGWAVWQLSIVGCSVRARDASDKARVLERLRDEVWPLLSLRRIVPRIHSSMDMLQLPDAVALLAARKGVGKLVCSWH